jgi:hypothetical protein
LTTDSPDERWEEENPDAERGIAQILGTDRPNVARMYDYFLGGARNFDVDREAAQAVLDIAPQIQTAARENRAFLGRVVRYTLDSGIRQFLDLGSGIPTVGNVHQLVEDYGCDARVVYVDLDPIAVANAQALLLGSPNAGIIQADLREPYRVLNHHTTQRLIDFNQPVAILFVSVLHFVCGDITPVINAYRRPAAPGSLLAVSHASPAATPEQAEPVQRLYERTPTPLRLRTPTEIRALFSGWDLVHPNPHGPAQPADLVPVTDWRPDRPGVPAPDDLGPFVTGFLAGAAHARTPCGPTA